MLDKMTRIEVNLHWEEVNYMIIKNKLDMTTNINILIK